MKRTEIMETILCLRECIVNVQIELRELEKIVSEHDIVDTSFGEKTEKELKFC